MRERVALGNRIALALGILLALVTISTARGQNFSNDPGDAQAAQAEQSMVNSRGLTLPGYAQAPPAAGPSITSPPPALAPPTVLPSGTPAQPTGLSAVQPPLNSPITPGFYVPSGSIINPPPQQTVGAGRTNGQLDEWSSNTPGVPTHGGVFFTDLDSFAGVGDQGRPSARGSANYGSTIGFNYATRLGRISDWTGIGFQVGGSYGVYDWNGRPFNAAALDFFQAQQQTFITLGFFRKADDDLPISFGIVHDWMINQAWGAYAVNPTLGQWRGQIAYAVDPWNEFGVWATLRDKGSSNQDWFGNWVVTRPIDQGNLFWHHKWELGTDSWLWVGIPQEDRLNQFAGGSLGNLLLGGSIVAPLNDRVSLYANAQYMHPSAAPGPVATGEASWYMAFGLQFTLGGHARTSTVVGNRWLPLMPVANNGNFLVDSTRVPGF